MAGSSATTDVREIHVGENLLTIRNMCIHAYEYICMYVHFSVTQRRAWLVVSILAALVVCELRDSLNDVNKSIIKKQTAKMEQLQGI